MLQRTNKEAKEVKRVVVKCDNRVVIADDFAKYFLSDAEAEKVMDFIESVILERSTEYDYAEVADKDEEFTSMQDVLDKWNEEEEAPKSEKKAPVAPTEKGKKVAKSTKASSTKAKKSDDNFDTKLYHQLGEEFEVVGKKGSVYRYARPIIYAVMNKTMTKKAASIEIANLKAKYGY